MSTSALCVSASSFLPLHSSIGTPPTWSNTFCQQLHRWATLISRHHPSPQRENHHQYVSISFIEFLPSFFLSICSFFCSFSYFLEILSILSCLSSSHHMDATRGATWFLWITLLPPTTPPCLQAFFRVAGASHSFPSLSWLSCMAQSSDSWPRWGTTVKM